MRVESIRLRLLLVGPLRLVLGAVVLVAARAAGASYGATLVAGGAGAFGIAFIASNDPRAHFRRSPGEPAELPSEASVAPAWLHVVHAALPSTVGVSILAAVTVAFQPTLTALLGGVLVGMGLAALFVAYAVDDRLYLEPRKRELFRKVR